MVYLFIYLYWPDESHLEHLESTLNTLKQLKEQKVAYGMSMLGGWESDTQSFSNYVAEPTLSLKKMLNIADVAMPDALHMVDTGNDGQFKSHPLFSDTTGERISKKTNVGSL